jgi:16S rRNA (guanine(966)-N(2))-methyltransferase RsmD
VTRPIPDRVKESLFGLLRGHCEGAHVFDGFAGTGSIGLEAVSRGATRCVCVERDKGAADLLRRNIESLNAQDRCELVVGDALGPGALARAPRPLTLAFLDPPYPLVRDPIGWERVKAQLQKLVDLLSDDGFAIVRTPWPFTLVSPAGGAEPVEEIASPDLKAKKRRPTREPKQGRWHELNAPMEETVQESVTSEEDEPDVARVPADLSLPNAVGPETHAYHSTALHLYMKKRSGA